MNMNEKHLHHNAKMMKDELRNDFQKAKEKTCEVCGTAYDTIAYAKHQATHMLKDSFNGLQNQAENLQDNVVGYVKNNPVKSLCYALLAGIIASHILRK
ncbi:MAG: hypothetical protein P4M14_02335 [Gammaproteobacteria bacterium]|nr:hypothetical protein [Gammaproteobacteria bacterium]